MSLTIWNLWWWSWLTDNCILLVARVVLSCHLGLTILVLWDLNLHIHIHSCTIHGIFFILKHFCLLIKYIIVMTISLGGESLSCFLWINMMSMFASYWYLNLLNRNVCLLRLLRYGGIMSVPSSLPGHKALKHCGHIKIQEVCFLR